MQNRRRYCCGRLRKRTVLSCPFALPKNAPRKKKNNPFFLFYFFIFFNLTYSRWTSSLPSCLWPQRIFPSLPGSRLPNFLRDASSALLQLVNQWYCIVYYKSAKRRKATLQLQYSTSYSPDGLTHSLQQVSAISLMRQCHYNAERWRTGGFTPSEITSDTPPPAVNDVRKH